MLWRKLAPDDLKRADAHFAGTLIYDLLYEKRYRLARILADFGVATFKKWGSDYFRRALVVNRAQAYIWDGRREEGLKIFEAEDWSAASNDFQVCVASLRQDFVGAIRCMRAIGKDGPPNKDGYRDWPVFREFRKTQEFQAAFNEIFGEPFGTVTLSPSENASVSPSATPSSDSSGVPSDLPISTSTSAPSGPAIKDDKVDGNEEAPAKVH